MIQILKDLELENKNWKYFSKIYYAADKETGWKMLLDEYWDAKKMFDKYTDGTTNNLVEWQVHKALREYLEEEILKRVLEENGYK